VPELPEVETVRAGLAPELVGRSIRALAITDFPGVIGTGTIEETSARIVDRSIADVARRGKFLMIVLDDGDGIVVHLRMTGVLTLDESSAPPPRFLRLSALLDDGRELRFADQRKFGRFVAASSQELSDLDGRLGPEPFGPNFTPDYLLTRLRGRRAPVKALLLDQGIVAGLGNIYVDEALFLARIHPMTSGGSLTPAQVSELHSTIVSVLHSGIARRGVSFSSFRDVYGNSGENQQHLVVYGRGGRGLPCLVCGEPVQRIVIGNRGTSFCPACQPFGQT